MEWLRYWFFIVVPIAVLVTLVMGFAHAERDYRRRLPALAAEPLRWKATATSDLPPDLLWEQVLAAVPARWYRRDFLSETDRVALYSRRRRPLEFVYARIRVTAGTDGGSNLEVALANKALPGAAFRADVSALLAHLEANLYVNKVLG